MRHSSDVGKKIFGQTSLREKRPYSEFFWSEFSRIWTEYRDIVSPHIRCEFGPEKLRTRTRFTQFLAQ